MKWEKEKIILSDGIEVEAQASVIISASRATPYEAFMELTGLDATILVKGIRL